MIKNALQTKMKTETKLIVEIRLKKCEESFLKSEHFWVTLYFIITAETAATRRRI